MTTRVQKIAPLKIIKIRLKYNVMLIPDITSIIRHYTFKISLFQIFNKQKFVFSDPSLLFVLITASGTDACLKIALHLLTVEMRIVEKTGCKNTDLISCVLYAQCEMRWDERFSPRRLRSKRHRQLCAMNLTPFISSKAWYI